MKRTIKIQNLKCGGCANTIITRLSALKGVTNVSVCNDTKRVSFVSEEKYLQKVYELLAKLGYPIVGESNPLTKKAKSYLSCAIGRLNN